MILPAESTPRRQATVEPELGFRKKAVTTLAQQMYALHDPLHKAQARDHSVDPALGKDLFLPARLVRAAERWKSYIVQEFGTPQYLKKNHLRQPTHHRLS